MPKRTLRGAVLVAIVALLAGVVKVDGKELKMDNGKPLKYQPFEVMQNLTNSPYIKTAGARMGWHTRHSAYHSLQSTTIVMMILSSHSLYLERWLTSK